MQNSKMMGKKQSSSSCDNSADSATIYICEENRVVSCSICKETGHKWFKCSQWICSICRETGHDPHKCPNMAKEDANLIADPESESRDLAKSNDAEDASVPQGEHMSLVLVVRGERRG